jgi:outer membrane protein assembly factor BamD
MKKYVIFLLIGMAAGCSTDITKLDKYLAPDRPQENTEGASAEELYKKATKAMNFSYDEAIRYFEALEAQYPYGRYAEQAQIETAYAYYKKDDKENALVAIDRFIRLHPTHPNLDYALYLKGLIYFKNTMDILSKISGQDMAERDPKMLEDAFAIFKELVTRFPGSKYAEDSRQRMRFLANKLAEHEIAVAHYYMKRGAYLAAVNRCRYVLEHYPTSPETKNALGIMVDAYGKLGMEEERKQTLKVLAENFPADKQAAPQEKRTAWWRIF